MPYFRHLAVVIWVSVASFVQAAPYEPPVGSELRQTLLDTFRPLAIFDLGAPVEFQVLELQVDGDIAFARLIAQRPGGQRIDMEATPMVVWRDVDPFEYDGPRFEVFYVRDGAHWQVVNYGHGATDMWWSGYRCDVFAPLMAQYGC